MAKFLSGSVFAVLFLGACATTVKFPAASVTRFADGTEWVMTGELFGSIDGSSRTVLSGDGITCEYNLTRQSDGSSAGSNVCTDNTSGEIAFRDDNHVVPATVKMGFNGKYVSQQDYEGLVLNGQPVGQGVTAFGWGRFADVEVLRGLLP